MGKVLGKMVCGKKGYSGRDDYSSEGLKEGVIHRNYKTSHCWLLSQIHHHKSV